MNPTEMKSLLSIAMLAAFADSQKDNREREEVRRVAESLGGDLNVAALYQEVLLGRVDVASAAAALFSNPSAAWGAPSPTPARRRRRRRRPPNPFGRASAPSASRR